jgi:hypothetical protein
MAKGSTAGGDTRLEDQLVRGYFALLRWRLDPTRDEARNIAVLLVDEKGKFQGFRHAAVSSISSRLQDQGIVDDVLLGLSTRFEEEDLALKDLEELHRSFQQSLLVTEPEPVAIGDPDETLDALYRSMIAPRAGRGRALTKGVLLDRVVSSLRKEGIRARRGAYIDDFIFDVVVPNGGPTSVLEVLSFAVPRKDWTPIEQDAAHFLYALGRVDDIEGRAVIQPPAEGRAGRASYDRIRRWLDDENVPTLAPDELIPSQLALELGHEVAHA